MRLLLFSNKIDFLETHLFSLTHVWHQLISIELVYAEPVN